MEKIKLFFKNNEIIRFLLIGGCSTLIDLAFYYLISTCVPILFSKALSMIISSLFSYFANKIFTFQNADKTSAKHLIKFYLVFAANLFVNTTVNYLVFNAFGIKIIAFAIATLCGLIVNYWGQKYFVFQSKDI